MIPNQGRINCLFFSYHTTKDTSYSFHPMQHIEKRKKKKGIMHIGR